MFELDLRSRKSIYEQIMDNLKELIMSEKLQLIQGLSWISFGKWIYTRIS